LRPYLLLSPICHYPDYGFALPRSDCDRCSSIVHCFCQLHCTLQVHRMSMHTHAHWFFVTTHTQFTLQSHVSPSHHTSSHLRTLLFQSTIPHIAAVHFSSEFTPGISHSCPFGNTQFNPVVPSQLVSNTTPPIVHLPFGHSSSFQVHHWWSSSLLARFTKQFSPIPFQVPSNFFL